MAKKEQVQQPKADVIRCGTCRNKGEQVYELIYKCKVDGEPHHSVVNCMNIFKSPIKKETNV